MVPVKTFNSAQTSAPTCTGEVDHLDAILYSCLVTGFNSITISSLTVTANVATVTTSTDHGYAANDIIVISGASPSALNDEFIIDSTPLSNQFTFSIATSNVTASGSMACKIAPLGWERTYADTNKAVYRSLDATGTQLYLHVDDTNAKYALVNMYETMSAIDTGTGQSTDVYWSKSYSADSTTRPWTLIGDSKRFWLNIAFTSQYSGDGYSLYFFGDILPWRNPDAYHCSLGGDAIDNSGYFPGYQSGMMTSNAYNGMFLARAADQTGTCVPFSYWSVSNGWFGYNNVPSTAYPSPVDSKVHLFPVYVYDQSALGFRGVAPGLYISAEKPQGAISTGDRTIVSEGRTFMAIKSMGAYILTWWFDITGPWS